MRALVTNLMARRSCAQELHGVPRLCILCCACVMSAVAVRHGAVPWAMSGVSVVTAAPKQDAVGLLRASLAANLTALSADEKSEARELAKEWLKVSMLGRHKKRRNQPMSPSRTTYAVLAYGLSNRAVVCNAATLGRALYLLDPSRPRTAIVGENVSSEVRRHLTNGHWKLHEACCLNRMNRKAELWRLPFKRVWYWDADTLPLDVSIAALQGVRSMHLGGHRVAATHESPECFNSGTLLLEPNMTLAQLVDTAAKHAQADAARNRWKRCSSGFDQLALNDVFSSAKAGRLAGFHRIEIPIKVCASPLLTKCTDYVPVVVLVCLLVGLFN